MAMMEEQKIIVKSHLSHHLIFKEQLLRGPCKLSRDGELMKKEEEAVDKPKQKEPTIDEKVEEELELLEEELDKEVSDYIPKTNKKKVNATFQAKNKEEEELRQFLEV